MRKSLRGIEHMVVPGVAYPGIPAELEKYHCYLRDAGHVLLCIPLSLEAESRLDPDDYEVGVPVKYVLSHHYAISGDHIYADVPYDANYGVNVPEEYEEFSI